MKKNLLLIAALFFSLNLLAQKNNIVVFAQGGERFTLILNGLKQNLQPETNVKVIDLDQPNYKLIIFFENTALGKVEKNLSFPEMGKEYVFGISNKKGVYKLTYVSEAPVKSDFDKVPEQKVIYYNQAPKDTVITTTTTTSTTTNGNVNGNAVNTTNTVNTNSNTTTITTTGNPTGTGIKINVNENGMNVDVTGTGMNVKETTTTTNGNSNSNTTLAADNGTSTTTTTTVVEKKAATNVTGTTTTTSAGCTTPMSDANFKTAKTSISSKSFEDSKLTVAKQVMKNKCLSTAQVKEIMLLFSFEQTRLDFAKAAYDYTTDRDNYYELNDAFTFESSIDDLNKYLETKK